MTLLEPPPERDLPPGRQQSMREEILRGIAGARRSRRPLPRFVRAAIPVAAAAAVAAVVFVAGVFIGVARDNAAPFAGHPAAQLPVPGFSDAQLTELHDACLKDLQHYGEVDPTGVGITPMRDQIDVDGLRVYNAVSDRIGTTILLYTTDGRASCTWDGPRTAHWPNQTSSGGFNDNDPNWLPGAASVDDGTSSSRWARLGGQVPAGVTRVEVTLDGHSGAADVVNGTYIATIDLTGEPSGPSKTTVRTFDRAGKQVGTYQETAGGCLVTPDGKAIHGTKTTDPSKCTKAVPWR
ncbi:hypothetical protein [Cryptosporangium phraense]|uniref:Uncharacterized protein n=1 Tax=Cryptosporangium phraense TaxID=2593070 RepID=A0A545ARC8_9ACTN|nr:hypothetical protein [Cryptosporangium phraense]TQS43862.1 hypothetical protein FL583_17735 [Cryptosporangium phraense]